MFHFGHANVLRQAHQHCDLLIVGVASDEICHEKKHIDPVMSFDERSATVAACRHADRVVSHTSFDESDLRRAQDQLGLTIRRHLVGEDFGCWGPEQNRRLDWCEENGIETIRLKYTLGISTTEIKARFTRRGRLPVDPDQALGVRVVALQKGLDQRRADVLRLSDQLTDVLEQKRRADEALAAANCAVATAMLQMTAVTHSTSWRLTAPVRRLRSISLRERT